MLPLSNTLEAGWTGEAAEMVCAPAETHMKPSSLGCETLHVALTAALGEDVVDWGVMSTAPAPSISYIAIAMSVEAAVRVTVGVPAVVTRAKNAIVCPAPAVNATVTVCHWRFRESVIVTTSLALSPTRTTSVLPSFTAEPYAFASVVVDVPELVRGPSANDPCTIWGFIVAPTTRGLPVVSVAKASKFPL